MAILILLFTIFGLPTMFIAWTAYHLAVNKALARTTGLPTIAVYVSPTNPLRLMFATYIIELMQYLPFDTSSLTRFHAHGWEANERSKAHQELGEAFIVTSPGGNYLYICDPEAVQDILQRKTDFRRDIVRMSILNVYGKNISTTEDGEWQIHRKATAAAFTESNNETVWVEASRQAYEMLQSWMTKKSDPVRTIAKDTRTFTLNVLAAALFSKRYPFEGSDGIDSKVSDIDCSSSTQYRDSLSVILRNIIPIYVFGSSKLESAWWVPTPWRSAGKAVRTFHSYVENLIEVERATPGQATKRQDLVSNLVRACEADRVIGDPSMPLLQARHRRTLTKQEIISNLFVYAFAGNDTTAITLAHALVSLASHPKTQEWVAEEVRHYAGFEDTPICSYSLFPKLKRCLAVMMETLRLCHPLGQLIKTTGEVDRSLKISNRIVILPRNLNVNINLAAIHTLPYLWGKNALAWSPERFVQGTGRIEEETLCPDTTKSFLPWAYGQKVCPGKKFSQVEFVAALATLFRYHAVTVQPEPGETQEDANARASHASIRIEKRLLNEMRKPQSVSLVWQKQ